MQTPFALVIFGATGDLARRKLLPALFNLYKEKQIPEKFYIVGFARRPFSHDEYRMMMEEALKIGKEPGDRGMWERFAQNLYYQQGMFDQEQGYRELTSMLEGFDKEIGSHSTRLFYLATPPDNYEMILNFLASTKLSEGHDQGTNQWTRIAIEKPFGKDLETAKMLDRKLAETFEEKQIFRVDHYLGKETVQNMLAFRFANSMFEPIWNSTYVDHVQITWGEKKGVAGRGKFFDGVGLLRDVAQNHLMQLVAAVAMEQPKSFTKESVRDARAAAIAAIECINPEEIDARVVRGQYEGYLEEKDVDSNSSTETYLAMKLSVNTPRFSGVPFYVRAGKHLPKDTVEISIVFVQTCHILFKEYGCPEEGNVLTIRIQPDEGIGLRVIAKKPGAGLSLGTVDMNFSYKDEFGGRGGDAYERVLMDILLGDQMLFNRSDELESSWEFITKVLEGWERPENKMIIYPKETWGPKEADELIQKDNRKWL